MRLIGRGLRTILRFQARETLILALEQLKTIENRFQNPRHTSNLHAFACEIRA